MADRMETGKLLTGSERSRFGGKVVDSDFGIPLIGGAIAVIVGATGRPTHGDVLAQFNAIQFRV